MRYFSTRHGCLISVARQHFQYFSKFFICISYVLAKRGFQKSRSFYPCFILFFAIFYLCKITRLIIYIFYMCCFFRDSSYPLPKTCLFRLDMYICPFLPNSEEIKPKVNQKSCLPTFYWVTMTTAYRLWNISSIFLCFRRFFLSLLFWKVFLKFFLKFFLKVSFVMLLILNF